jgi:hypothetical protein
MYVNNGRVRIIKTYYANNGRPRLRYLYWQTWLPSTELQTGGQGWISLPKIFADNTNYFSAEKLSLKMSFWFWYIYSTEIPTRITTVQTQ